MYILIILHYLMALPPPTALPPIQHYHSYTNTTSHSITPSYRITPPTLLPPDTPLTPSYPSLPPGVVYTMARAYLLWKEQKYLNSCLLIGELTWSRGLLRKGPGICHGVSGRFLIFILILSFFSFLTPSQIPFPSSSLSPSLHHPNSYLQPHIC